eukprot:1349739-Rhodomonas_salina.1
MSGSVSPEKRCRLPPGRAYSISVGQYRTSRRKCVGAHPISAGLGQHRAARETEREALETT